MCCKIRELAKDRFPDEELTNYTAISGFIFLRFFNPVILTPNLYNLDVGMLDDSAKRKLTLVAKTIQNLSNMTLFGKKEVYMQPVNAFISNRLDQMKKFLDDIAVDDCYESTNNNEDGSKECAELVEIFFNTMDKFNAVTPTIEFLPKLQAAISLVQERTKSFLQQQDSKFVEEEVEEEDVEDTNSSGNGIHLAAKKFGWKQSTQNFVMRTLRTATKKKNLREDSLKETLLVNSIISSNQRNGEMGSGSSLNVERENQGKEGQEEIKQNIALNSSVLSSARSSQKNRSNQYTNLQSSKESLVGSACASEDSLQSIPEKLAKVHEALESDTFHPKTSHPLPFENSKAENTNKESQQTPIETDEQLQV